MGLVHFLHGLIPPLKPDSKKTIICPNDDCHQEIDGWIMHKGKKSCPHCKTPIPKRLLEELKDN